MKKLMIAAAITLAATFVQAAAVGWQCAGATSYALGKYAIVIQKDSAPDVSALAAIVAASGVDGLDAWATGTVAQNGAATVQNSSADAGTITYSGEGTDRYYAVMFVENAAGTEASYTAAKYVDLANNSTSKTFQFGQQATNFTANKFAVGAVPEPTSGLLLLLGVAGLALRRRRA